MQTEIFIAADDPVSLVSAVVERMDIRKIERSYSREGRNEYPPRILLKVMVYAYMRRIYSTREIERACRENICFMYLLGDNPAPDHNTVARFRAERLLGCEKELLPKQIPIPAPTESRSRWTALGKANLQRVLKWRPPYTAARIAPGVR